MKLYVRYKYWSKWQAVVHYFTDACQSFKLSIHWDQVTSICVSNLTIIGSENGLSPGRRRVIIWTNAGILLIGPFGTNFSEILIEIQTFPFKNMSLKMSSAKWWSFCLGLKCAKKTRNQYLTSSTLTEIWTEAVWLFRKRSAEVPPLNEC